MQTASRTTLNQYHILVCGHILCGQDLSEDDLLGHLWPPQHETGDVQSRVGTITDLTQPGGRGIPVEAASGNGKLLIDPSLSTRQGRRHQRGFYRLAFTVADAFYGGGPSVSQAIVTAQADRQSRLTPLCGSSPLWPPGLRAATPAEPDTSTDPPGSASA